MSGPGNGSTPGLLVSLRRLIATALEIGQVRLALLGVELEQEKLRIFDGLAWAALALLLLGIGVTLGVGLLLLLFWDGYRIAALGVLCTLFLAGGVLAARLARGRMSNPTGSAVAASLEELSRDRAALEGRE